jgi:predicted RNase H-like HicB family nuclease
MYRESRLKYTNKTYACRVYNTTDGYFAFSGDCEGLYGEGNTASQAIDQLRQAVELRIKELLNLDGNWGWKVPKDGRQFPLPSNTDDADAKLAWFHEDFSKDPSFIDFFTSQFTVFLKSACET